jgi:hypothetical protein
MSMQPVGPFPMPRWCQPTAPCPRHLLDDWPTTRAAADWRYADMTAAMRARWKGKPRKR